MYFTTFTLVVWCHVSLELIESFWIYKKGKTLQVLSPYFVFNASVILLWPGDTRHRKENLWISRGIPGIKKLIFARYIPRHFTVWNWLALSWLCPPCCTLPEIKQQKKLSLFSHMNISREFYREFYKDPYYHKSVLSTTSHTIHIWMRVHISE